MLPLFLSWWRGQDLNLRPPGPGSETAPGDQAFALAQVTIDNIPDSDIINNISKSSAYPK